MHPLPTKPALDLPAVDALISAARHRAVQLGGRFTVVVVDDAANLRSLFRGDGADPLTVGLASGKARLSASNGMPTRDWRSVVGNDPYLGLTVPTVLDQLLTGAVLFAGGYPIVVEQTVVGAIGASGGTEDEDDDVARAGLAALPFADQFTAQPASHTAP
ncbi:GlcG/HbpS family heme-binding protein [Georgenia sp. Z1344]|uniref:GlcG/HbpS family heme-binding protein n=1 Tax=Georgenia sp. Z1344 TaxID=3416706 RepID=UPI003CF7C6A9